MKKNHQFSIGLWSTDDVKKVAESNQINIFRKRVRKDIKRSAISRHLIHIRKYISNCLEAEVQREFKKVLKEHHQKQTDRYGEE